MLRSFIAPIAALFIASALFGCSSDSSAPPAQQTPAEDAATETATGEDAQTEAQTETSTTEDAAEEPEAAAMKDCPIEKDLKTYVPCMCFDIPVITLEEAYPGCTKTVKCCPLGGGEIKCE
jgi:hypothetical protein